MIRLNDHVERMHAAGQSRRTIGAREEVITRLARDLGDLTAVTTQQLASWLARPGWSKATRAIYRYHVRMYFAWLVQAGELSVSPAVELTLIRVPKPPPRPVSEDMLRQILARTRNPHYRLYFILAAYAGLRCEEIVRLHTEHVTETVMTVLGKGGKTRLVPTHPTIWAAVQGLPAGPVSHYRHDDPHRAAHAMSSAGSRYLARIGFPGITMHRFRHRFGSEVYRLTRNLRAVQQLLGHASIVTTERYTWVSDEERRLAVWALPAA